MNQARFPSLKALSDAIGHYINQHPQSLSAMLAIALLTSGATAFAVAELGPDPADLPVRQVLESVTSQAATLPPLSVADILPFTLYRTETVRSSDSIDTLLARLGVADSAAAAYLRASAAVRQQILGKAGRSVQAETDDNHQLTRLTVRYVDDDSGNFKRLVVTPRPQTAPGGKRAFASRTETAPLTASERLGGGIVQSTLFAAMDAARLPDDLTRQLTEVFGNKIDFRNGVRRGDRFSIVYETLEADGEAIGTGRILSAEFINQGRAYNAQWFQAAPGSKGSYYAFNGDSLQSNYLPSPLAYTRLTSSFGPRNHPIQQRWKAHTGADLAAPAGTPIRTVSDGVVEFAGVQSGYGNVVYVRHSASHVTVYAHMSSIGVRTGEKISQGAIIGRVGSTGWATGPHLHFELRVNGEFQNPMALALSNEDRRLPDAARPAFDRAVAMSRINLGAATDIRTASAQ